MFTGFYDLIFRVLFDDGNTVLSDVTTTISGYGDMGFDNYISMILALICTITVYVVVCLFIYKVIRLFGRLWSRF